MTDQNVDQHSEQEASRRRDEIVRRMLSTPPKPHAKPEPGRRPERPIAS